MKVPFFSLKQAPKELKRLWLEAIDFQIEMGELIGGQAVAEFERKWSQFNEFKYSVGVGNGYDGLRLSLAGLGIGKGDRVAVPAHTFIATWFAIHSVGAIPVGIDSDNFGLMDLNELENLHEEVKAVIPVHMHGACVDMKRLSDWARKRNVIVIEDASQAHGGITAGKSRNFRGDAIVFSFYPTKNLGALGDAGIVSTDNIHLAERLSELRDYGRNQTDKTLLSQIGVNSRLDAIQARILSINLENLKSDNLQRKRIAHYYLEHLPHSDIKPLHEAEINSVYHHFVVLSENRDALKEYLAKHGVNTEIHYQGVAGNQFESLNKLPVRIYNQAERISKMGLSLPCNQWTTLEDAKQVMDIVSKFTEEPM